MNTISSSSSEARASRPASAWDLPRPFGTRTLVVLLPVALLRGESLLPHTLHGVLMLLALALVSHVGGQGLIAYALAKLPAALSSITLLVQPVIATVLGGWLFHEYLSLTEFAGGAIILIGIVTARRFS